MEKTEPKEEMKEDDSTDEDDEKALKDGADDADIRDVRYKLERLVFKQKETINESLKNHHHYFEYL